MDSLSQKITIYLGPKSSSDEIPIPEINLGTRFSPNQRFGGQLRTTLSHLAEIASTEDQIVIVSRQIERLKQLWEDLAV